VLGLVLWDVLLVGLHSGFQAFAGSAGFAGGIVITLEAQLGLEQRGSSWQTDLDSGHPAGCVAG